MIPILSGLLFFLIFLFVWIGLVMLFLVITGIGNAELWLLFAPFAGVIGFIFGYMRSRSQQKKE